MASPFSGITRTTTASTADASKTKYFENKFSECEKKILVAQKEGKLKFPISCEYLSESHKQKLRDRNIVLHPSQYYSDKTWLTSPGYAFQERLTAGEHFDCERYNLPCQDLPFDYDPEYDLDLFIKKARIISGKY